MRGGYTNNELSRAINCAFRALPVSVSGEIFILPTDQRVLVEDKTNKKNGTFHYLMPGTWPVARQLSRSRVFHLSNYLHSPAALDVD